ncbi:hypothetical protein ACWIUD_01475 [Helicobacter sp. 23-1044]
MGIVDFHFLKRIKLKFYEGIIHEDHLFGKLLLAQSKSIIISPKKLYKRRVRIGSTMTFKSNPKRKLPAFINDLNATFSNVDLAWEYFRAYSWCVMAQEFIKFIETYENKEICQNFKERFLRHLLGESCNIMNFKSDPYKMQGDFLAMAGRFGGKYLPKSKRRYAYYNSPILWRNYGIYTMLSAIKWRIKKIWKS